MGSNKMNSQLSTGAGCPLLVGYINKKTYNLGNGSQLPNFKGITISDDWCQGAFKVKFQSLFAMKWPKWSPSWWRKGEPVTTPKQLQKTRVVKKAKKRCYV